MIGFVKYAGRSFDPQCVAGIGFDKTDTDFEREAYTFIWDNFTEEQIKEMYNRYADEDATEDEFGDIVETLLYYINEEGLTDEGIVTTISVRHDYDRNAWGDIYVLRTNDCVEEFKDAFFEYWDECVINMCLEDEADAGEWNIYEN